MVSWLPHILLPGLFALAFLRPLPRRWVIALAPVAWVPDLDFVSNLLEGQGHRVLSHNVWIPLAFLGLSWWVWRRRNTANPEGTEGLAYWQAAMRPGWSLGLLLCAYYWASHVLFDVFAGGALLLWPLSTLNFYLFYEIHFDLSTGAIDPVAEGGTEEGPPALSSDYTWLSYEHTAALAFLAVAALVSLAAWIWRRRGAATAKRGGDAGSRGPSTKGK